jgi:putative endonuclease
VATRHHDRARIGRDAEDAATRYLESHQLRIIARNYRCRTGELDIIAETASGVVVIAEVRMRADQRFGGAAASVDWRKQRRILRAARHLIVTQPALGRRAMRFDVLDLAPAAAGYRIEWIQHAFDAGGG